MDGKGGNAKEYATGKQAVHIRDLVAEIISPSTLKYDLTVKKRLYERSGVKEYWMVYPLERIIMIYKLQENGHYDDGEAYGKKDIIPVGLFHGWELVLADIFE